MTSNRVFLAAAVLIAGLLTVAFTTPETSNEITEDASVRPVPDGRVGPRYRVDESADPHRTRNMDTRAELDAVYSQEMSRKDAADEREIQEAPKRRSIWDRLLGRGKRAETDDVKSR